jgi:hypothetical protein
MKIWGYSRSDYGRLASRNADLRTLYTPSLAAGIFATFYAIRRRYAASMLPSGAVDALACAFVFGRQAYYIISSTTDAATLSSGGRPLSRKPAVAPPRLEPGDPPTSGWATARFAPGHWQPEPACRRSN